ncbi:ABC transporter permease [Cryobacterium sp. TMS1-20-1]|uniref:ABC transporter permease n=1 Tax=Cryobacterium sp. TMS1-20-1 TaxID=1259223 RepID=UPI00141A807A|nr:ABC transporter permease [Cryobacterium sp. TMS1-20-1]
MSAETETALEVGAVAAPVQISRQRSVGREIGRFGLPLLLVILIFVFATNGESSAAFTSLPNIRQLLANQAVTGLIALAMVVPLVAGYFDLSVGAAAGASSIVFAQLVGPLQVTPVLAIAVAMVVAILIGAVNGFLVAVLRLNGLIVTLGTYILLQGVLQWLTGGSTISDGIPEEVGRWGSNQFLFVPQAFWLLIIVAVIVWYLLSYFPRGRELESIGSNERAAHLVGVRVRRNIFFAFLSAGFIAGIAGVLLTSRAGSADPTSGPGYLFPALAAVFLGATCFRPGKYNVWGAILGVYFLAIAVNGLTLLGADSWVTPVFNGAALIVAVMISTMIGRRRGGSSSAP